MKNLIILGIIIIIFFILPPVIILNSHICENKDKEENEEF